MMRPSASTATSVTALVWSSPTATLSPIERHVLAAGGVALLLVAAWYAAALWWIRRSEARPAAVAAPRAPRAPRLLKYKSVEGEGAAPEGFEL